MNSRQAAGASGERRPVGALEAEVLAQLQSAGAPLTAGEVLTRLGSALAYSTVVTVLTRMRDKGLLTRTKQGRAYAYAPVTDTHGLTARRMRRAMESDPDRKAVLSRFVDDLSPDDEALLRRLLGVEEPPGQ
ncbi:BlaI/MecI/CopY family transcriptional regulator [Kitasatospora sp. NBC_01250]|uniref:BlaI/MecI/CopY family transcriptional regulator n=1 Tax=unclassified Kitasatospora TaxID=2633591 RepID=UPI002E0FAD92|nr:MULTISPECIES: BlaI/MecI/CopY family transcriptional regulator [unclassified Kitasatospora]WSJ71022.1 BlaI/MecI/CopY family transcriptional regulator [Kitasatospora sp. NBC_01302]